MKYKGYIGYATYYESDKIFYGRVLGLTDIITFLGTSIDELENAFRDTVDEYLSWCKELGNEPEKTHLGNLLVRIDPELHIQLIRESTKKNISLNDLMLRKLFTKDAL